MRSRRWIKLRGLYHLPSNVCKQHEHPNRPRTAMYPRRPRSVALWGYHAHERGRPPNAMYPRRPRRVALWGTFTRTHEESFTTEHAETSSGDTEGGRGKERASHASAIFPLHNPIASVIKYCKLQRAQSSQSPCVHFDLCSKESPYFIAASIWPMEWREEIHVEGLS